MLGLTFETGDAAEKEQSIVYFPLPGVGAGPGLPPEGLLVTDAGMVIRCPVNDIRIARRRSQGVVIFKLGDGERVVSVARLPEVSEENGGANGLDDAAENQQTDEGDI